jgi:hypothetical protein
MSHHPVVPIYGFIVPENADQIRERLVSELLLDDELEKANAANAKAISLAKAAKKKAAKESKLKPIQEATQRRDKDNTSDSDSDSDDSCPSMSMHWAALSPYKHKQRKEERLPEAPTAQLPQQQQPQPQSRERLWERLQQLKRASIAKMRDAEAQNADALAQAQEADALVHAAVAKAKAKVTAAAKAKASAAAAARMHQEQQLCVVCFVDPKAVVLIPCGHISMCARCCGSIRAAKNEVSEHELHCIALHCIVKPELTCLHVRCSAPCAAPRSRTASTSADQ